MQPPAPDICKEIALRIAAREPCWFPGLAESLTAAFWADAVVLDPGLYTTAAWVGGAASATVEQVPGQPIMVVEPLPAGLGARFEGPAFAEIAPAPLHAIADALGRLAASGAVDAVTSLIRSVHCIAARGPGHDCSHSDPTIPFSVFVSVPTGERYAELRLAESLFHEALHLQLTLIERYAPIVAANAGSGYSPWQQRQRPVQGLLHGLYVFAAIHQWLSTLAAEATLPADDRIYVERRLREIELEVGEVATLKAAPGLTGFGRTLAGWLLRPFQLVPASRSVSCLVTG